MYSNPQYNGLKILGALVVVAVLGIGIYAVGRNAKNGNVNLAKPPTSLASYGTKVASGNCTYTQGYWKNHPEAWQIGILGTPKSGSAVQTNFTISPTDWRTWMTVFNTSATGDARVILAYQLYAAKLNLANGANGSSVQAAITEASSLLTANALTRVDPASEIGKKMVELGAALDAYNNGVTGPGHCGTATAGSTATTTGTATATTTATTTGTTTTTGGTTGGTTTSGTTTSTAGDTVQLSPATAGTTTSPTNK